MTTVSRKLMIVDSHPNSSIVGPPLERLHIEFVLRSIGWAPTVRKFAANNDIGIPNCYAMFARTPDRGIKMFSKRVPRKENTTTRSRDVNTCFRFELFREFSSARSIMKRVIFFLWGISWMGISLASGDDCLTEFHVLSSDLFGVYRNTSSLTHMRVHGVFFNCHRKRSIVHLLDYSTQTKSLPMDTSMYERTWIISICCVPRPPSFLPIRWWRRTISQWK